jgi:hypothetical protein
MDKTLVPVPPVPLAVAPEPAAIPGLDELGRADMILPRVRLVQAQSQFSDKAGELHNSLLNTTKPSINAIVIGVKRGRVMWPGDFQRGQDPICASDDGATAREGLAGVMEDGEPTTGCNACIYGDWGEDGAAPPCALFYNFLAVDVDEGDVPFLIGFGRTSAKAGKQLVTLLKTFGFKRTLIIGTDKQQNDKGKYHILTVKPGDPVDPERQAYYAAMARAFAGVAITTDTEAPEAATGDGGNADMPF